MRCQRFRCEVSEKLCILRQTKPFGTAAAFPECQRCPQGTAVLKAWDGPLPEIDRKAAGRRRRANLMHPSRRLNAEYLTWG